jgi:manganese/zinc/iron transport system permease protein
MGDALSHATLPGIALVFLLFATKDPLQLLLGGAATGALGVLCVLGIRACARTREDAAIGIVLSVFFAAGMALFSIVQALPTGEQAGLLGYIYGKAASMNWADVQRTAVVAGIVLACVAVLFKEFRAVCFDREFAAAQGVSVGMVDLLMMILVVFTTVIGLYAVGLIMIVALLIIPPAAARFWTDDLTVMTVLAGLFGVLSGWLGAMVSALFPRMPAGALIVMSAGTVFVLSMLIAPRRGLLGAALRQIGLRRGTARQNLLRAFAELEERLGEGTQITCDQLRAQRGWSRHALHRALRQAGRSLLVTGDAHVGYRLSTPGRVAAKRVLRNHRLWELFLIRYADIAPSHVDRDADEIEHVLGEDVVAELERALAERKRIPASPHPMGSPS